MNTCSFPLERGCTELDAHACTYSPIASPGDADAQSTCSSPGSKSPHRVHPFQGDPPSVPVARTVVLRTHNQTSALLRTLVHRLQDIDNLLLVFQHPIQLVVVTRPEITHHMFIPKEEHDGARVVEFVHLLEVGHLVQIAEVDDGKVLDAIGDFVEHLVLAHAVGIPITAEPDYHQAVFFGHDGLVDVPCSGQMGDDNGTHGGGAGAVRFGLVLMLLTWMLLSRVVSDMS